MTGDGDVRVPVGAGSIGPGEELGTVGDGREEGGGSSKRKAPRRDSERRYVSRKVNVVLGPGITPLLPAEEEAAIDAVAAASLGDPKEKGPAFWGDVAYNYNRVALAGIVQSARDAQLAKARGTSPPPQLFRGLANGSHIENMFSRVSALNAELSPLPAGTPPQRPRLPEDGSVNQPSLPPPPPPPSPLPSPTPPALPPPPPPALPPLTYGQIQKLAARVAASYLRSMGRGCPGATKNVTRREWLAEQFAANGGNSAVFTPTSSKTGTWTVGI